MHIFIRTINPLLFAKPFSALPLILSITACGGGGDGGSGDNSAEASTINETTTIETAEFNQETTTVAGTITQIDAVREHSGIELSQTRQTSIGTQDDAKSTSSSIYVSVQELQNDADARYQIHHSTATDKYITTLTINAKNTSALDDIAKAEQITTLSTNTLVLADEQRLCNILLQLEYLAGMTNPATMDDTKAVIAELIDRTTAASQSAKDQLAKALTDYREGKVSEQALKQSIAEMEASLEDAASVGDDVLQEFDKTLTALIKELPDQLQLTYDPIQGRYTRFTNESLGQYTETGEWQFDTGYDWLNAALQMKAKQN